MTNRLFCGDNNEGRDSLDPFYRSWGTFHEVPSARKNRNGVANHGVPTIRLMSICMEVFKPRGTIENEFIFEKRYKKFASQRRT